MHPRPNLTVMRAAAALLTIGVTTVVLFGAMSYLAAIWGFVSMDNPPPGAPYLLLWNIGLAGLAAGGVLTVAGAILALIAWIRRAVSKT